MNDPGMHPVDQAIIEGTLTPELLANHLAEPLPAQGTSYWGDELHSALAFGATLDEASAWIAARRAAHMMGTALASYQAVTR